MRRIIAIATAALAVATAHAAPSPAATQAWVKDYVSKLNGGTNDVIAVDAGTNGTMSATFEIFSERALVATNCVVSASAPITNGTVFAYVGNGTYRNAKIGETVQATATNFTWRGVGSSVVAGLDRFAGAFSVAGTRITPSQMEDLK